MDRPRGARGHLAAARLRVRVALAGSARTRAASCYALPFVPALIALVCVRHDRFVRAHAARALLFYSAIVVVQLLLFGWLVVLGNLVTGWPLVVLSLLFYSAVAATGILALRWWLRAIADALAGRAVADVGFGRFAARVQRALASRAAGSRVREENKGT